MRGCTWADVQPSAETSTTQRRARGRSEAHTGRPPMGVWDYCRGFRDGPASSGGGKAHQTSGRERCGRTRKPLAMDVRCARVYASNSANLFNITSIPLSNAPYKHSGALTKGNRQIPYPRTCNQPNCPRCPRISLRHHPRIACLQPHCPHDLRCCRMYRFTRLSHRSPRKLENVSLECSVFILQEHNPHFVFALVACPRAWKLPYIQNISFNPALLESTTYGLLYLYDRDISSSHPAPRNTQQR